MSLRVKQNLCTFASSGKLWVYIQLFVLKRRASASSCLIQNSGLIYDLFNGGLPGCTCTCAGCTGSCTCLLMGRMLLQRGLQHSWHNRGWGWWRQLQCRWSSFCHGCLYMFTHLVPVTLTTICLKIILSFVNCQVSLL